MAHFIGYLNGARGEASRLGSKDGGIRARVQGWKLGVKVEGRHDGVGDWFTIFATGGSDHATPDRQLAVVGLKDDGEMFMQLDQNNPILVALKDLLSSIGRCSITPGALERVELKEEMNAAVAKARRAISENRMPNSVGMAGTTA